MAAAGGGVERGKGSALLQDLEQGRGEKVIATFESLLAGRREAAHKAVAKEIHYFRGNLARLRCKEGKRPGQFRTRAGDESLVWLA